MVCRLSIRIPDVPDGFDVRSEQLGRGAVDLRADAEGLDDAAPDLGATVDQEAAACGSGALAGAASEFSAQIDSAVHAIRSSLVVDRAGALEASSTQYLMSGGGTGAGPGGVAVPGVGGPC